MCELRQQTLRKYENFSYLLPIYNHLTKDSVRELCSKMPFAKQRREMNISLTLIVLMWRIG